MFANLRQISESPRVKIDFSCIKDRKLNIISRINIGKPNTKLDHRPFSNIDAGILKRVVAVRNGIVASRLSHPAQFHPVLHKHGALTAQGSNKLISWNMAGIKSIRNWDINNRRAAYIPHNTQKCTYCKSGSGYDP
jgi:hypothetical protein